MAGIDIEYLYSYRAGGPDKGTTLVRAQGNTQPPATGWPTNCLHTCIRLGPLPAVCWDAIALALGRAIWRGPPCLLLDRAPWRCP